MLIRPPEGIPTKARIAVWGRLEGVLKHKDREVSSIADLLWQQVRREYCSRPVIRQAVGGG
jgi:hypothetical protein